MVRRHVYPYCAGFATVCAVMAALLVQDPVYKVGSSFFSTCLERLTLLLNHENLQVIHCTAVIGGVVLTVMSFFYSIYRVDLLYKIAIAGNVTLLAMMWFGLTTIMEIIRKAFYLQAPNSVLECESIGVELKDTIAINCKAGIVIIVLDLLAFFCSTFALCSSRTWIG